jgi:lysophospholipid acyltransferase (LPLAT)-like uncharacterized protein
MIVSFGIGLLRLLAFTWRYVYSGEKPSVSDPSIIVFWHEHMLPGWHAHRNMIAKALVSPSKDGEILTRLLDGWGIQTIRGSSSQTGKEALQGMTTCLKSGMSILLTPDGPRGPRQTFKAGAAIASIRTSLPLFLVCIEVDHCYIFKKSWDRFKLPLPYSTIRITYTKMMFEGDPESQDDISTFIADCELKLREEH